MSRPRARPAVRQHPSVRFHLPADLLATVREQATAEDVTVTQWLVEACRCWSLVGQRDGDAGMSDPEWRWIVTGEKD